MYLESYINLKAKLYFLNKRNNELDHELNL